MNYETLSFMYSIWGIKKTLNLNKQGLFFLPNNQKVFIRP